VIQFKNRADVYTMIARASPNVRATQWHVKTQFITQYTWCTQEHCLTNYQNLTWQKGLHFL